MSSQLHFSTVRLDEERERERELATLALFPFCNLRCNPISCKDSPTCHAISAQKSYGTHKFNALNLRSSKFAQSELSVYLHVSLIFFGHIIAPASGTMAAAVASLLLVEPLGSSLLLLPQSEAWSNVAPRTSGISLSSLQSSSDLNRFSKFHCTSSTLRNVRCHKFADILPLNYAASSGQWPVSKIYRTLRIQTLRSLKPSLLSESSSRGFTSKTSVKCLTTRSEASSTDPPGVQVKTSNDGIINGYYSPTASTSGEIAKGEDAPENLSYPDGYHGWNKPDTRPFLSITVLGATGDLARNKIFPALFALYYSENLYEKVAIFGYSRSALSDDEFRELLSGSMTCRVDEHEKCGDAMESFLENIYYESGGYSTCDGMSNLDKRLREREGTGEVNRIFYLSVPHEIVPEVSSCLSKNAQSKTGWTRLIVEKPFGTDTNSSEMLTDGLLKHLDENQIYRIDHHLGKELIENLTVLRFSNLVFEPLWTRTYIRNVQVILAEDWGMEGRGGYFDQQGIIRDIVQSHLMQTIALFAMEPPVSLDGDDIRNEKVKVLRSMRRPTLQDVSLGQYKASVSKDGKSKVCGYQEEPGVPPNSLTPTFIAAVLYIDNARWDGVPFLIKAGSGLINHKVEIRIQFRHVPGNLYREQFGFNMASNELIIAIQPNEAIYLKINNKVPGLGTQLDSSELNLLYREKYDDQVIPDSYERLILDVIKGDNHLFIRSDELKATWDLLTPLLKEVEENQVVPELYTFGGRGPIGAYYLGAKHGVRWADE